jgi:ribonuclease VapC
VILDSSAVVGMILREPGFESLVERLGDAARPAIGAPTLVETGIVLGARLGTPGRTLLARFLTEAGVSVVAFGEDHWLTAVDAYARFGQGRHPAQLNFGDCMSYAVAKVAGEPLLCLGDDFARTDLQLVGSRR